LEDWNDGIVSISSIFIGELHLCYKTFKQAGQIQNDEYEKFDELHYNVENALPKLIKSLQRKQRDKDCEEGFRG
jgi:hypothetical protein